MIAVESQLLLKDKHSVKLLTIREKPDKMNSQRSEVVVINKENVAQDGVKVL